MPKSSLNKITEEHGELAENQEKRAIVEKCVDVNKRTRMILVLAANLLTLVQKGYAVLDKPWSKEHRTLALRAGNNIDVFSNDFVLQKITPTLEKLQTACEEVIGFTEFFSSNEGLLGMMEHTQSLREQAITMSTETMEQCRRFLNDRDRLNRILPIFAYLQVNSRLSESLRDVGTLLSRVINFRNTLNVIILGDLNRTLPLLKAERQQGFFSKPTPPLKNEPTNVYNSQAERFVPNPQNWNRATLGKRN
jgi:hypothetical protein